MQMQKMPNPNCLLYSTAMVLNVPASKIIAAIGHEGQEIIWPNQEGQLRLRGIHMQELVDYALTQECALVSIEKHVAQAPTHEDVPYSYLDDYACESRFQKYLSRYDAILIGETPSGHRHAVAWSCADSRIFDPCGWMYPYSDFNSNCAFLCVRL
jgi:hypothetical protein